MQALLVEAADGNQQVASQAKLIYSVLRIRDVYPGSEFFFHPDSRIRIFFHPGPRIGIQKLFLNPRKYDPDPGCSFWIPDPDPDFLPIPDPGSQFQRSKRHRIPDPQHCLYRYMFRLPHCFTNKACRILCRGRFLDGWIRFLH
jgi:hypothetical protein